MDLVALFNGCEAVLWLVLATVVALRFRTSAPRLRRVSWRVSVLLVAFGISDVIEMHTGAWWRPPALLVLKGVCLVGLVPAAAALIVLQRRTDSRHR